jgi:cell division protein FtsL
LKLPRWATGTKARVIMSVLVLVLAGGYVFKTSALSTSGYEINSLEKKIKKLSTEVRKIDADVASASSMSSIEDRVEDLGMVAVQEIVYLSGSSEQAVVSR